MKKNKYLNGVLPMFLINFSIGAVYCWTLFKESVNEYANFPPWVVEWCFSFAIFFLGMSAAFGGKIVEKNPKKSAFLTFIFFTTGWILTGLGIQFKLAWLTVLGFGGVQGMGLGLGYITPVKTMMIWLDNKKGLAAGLSIASFGIAGVIANPIIGALLETDLKVYQVFYILAAIYAVALFVASRLLYRPHVEEPEDTVTLKASEVIFHWKFILLWLVIFLNITCGLAIISQEKQIYNIIGISSMTIVVVYCSINAISNVAGRLSLASWQDALKKKHIPYLLMATCSLVICYITAAVYAPLEISRTEKNFETYSEIKDELLAAGQDFEVKDLYSDQSLRAKVMSGSELGNMVKAGTIKEQSVTAKVFNDGIWTTVTYLMVITVVLIFVVQFFFGVGFGCLPNVLHQNYGLHQLSTVHGLVLSAWGCAGLVGNQLSGYIIRNYTLTTLYITLAILYTIMFVILLIWTRVIKAGKKFA